MKLPWLTPGRLQELHFVGQGLVKPTSGALAVLIYNELLSHPYVYTSMITICYEFIVTNPDQKFYTDFPSHASYEHWLDQQDTDIVIHSYKVGGVEYLDKPQMPFGHMEYVS